VRTCESSLFNSVFRNEAVDFLSIIVKGAFYQGKALTGAVFYSICVPRRKNDLSF